MNTHNKRNKLFCNDRIIKSTFPCEPCWYKVSDMGDDDEPQKRYYWQRIIAFAVVEDWTATSELPLQVIEPITSDDYEVVIGDDMGGYKCRYLPSETRFEFFTDFLGEQR